MSSNKPLLELETEALAAIANLKDTDGKPLVSTDNVERANSTGPVRALKDYVTRYEKEVGTLPEEAVAIIAEGFPQVAESLRAGNDIKEATRNVAVTDELAALTSLRTLTTTLGFEDANTRLSFSRLAADNVIEPFEALHQYVSKRGTQLTPEEATGLMEQFPALREAVEAQAGKPVDKLSPAALEEAIKRAKDEYVDILGVKPNNQIPVGVSLDNILGVEDVSPADDVKPLELPEDVKPLELPKELQKKPIEL